MVLLLKEAAAPHIVERGGAGAARLILSGLGGEARQGGHREIEAQDEGPDRADEAGDPEQQPQIPAEFRDFERDPEKAERQQQAQDRAKCRPEPGITDIAGPQQVAQLDARLLPAGRGFRRIAAAGVAGACRAPADQRGDGRKGDGGPRVAAGLAEHQQTHRDAGDGDAGRHHPEAPRRGRGRGAHAALPAAMEAAEAAAPAGEEGHPAAAIAPERHAAAETEERTAEADERRGPRGELRPLPGGEAADRRPRRERPRLTVHDQRPRRDHDRGRAFRRHRDRPRHDDGSLLGLGQKGTEMMPRCTRDYGRRHRRFPDYSPARCFAAGQGAGARHRGRS